MESIILSMLGGTVGAGLAYVGVNLTVSLICNIANFAPIHVSLSRSMLIFSFGFAQLTGILFGTVPTWLISCADPIEALRRQAAAGVIGPQPVKEFAA
jgi:ABC-type antimicrobial peptide transport system permease subunit